MANIAELTDQASKVAQFLGIDLPSTAINPKDAQAEGAKGVSTANDRLRKAEEDRRRAQARLDEALTASTTTSTNTTLMVNLLTEINNALGGKPVKVPVQRDGAKRDTNGQVPGGKVIPR